MKVFVFFLNDSTTISKPIIIQITQALTHLVTQKKKKAVTQNSSRITYIITKVVEIIIIYWTIQNSSRCQNFEIVKTQIQPLKPFT